jgi:Xaa-Pro dipeptidase
MSAATTPDRGKKLYRNPFTDAEIVRRLEALSAELGRLDLDAAVIAAPENVFYLTGLDHWGYFAPHLLIVPVAGTPVSSPAPWSG